MGKGGGRGRCRVGVGVGVVGRAGPEGWEEEVRMSVYLYSRVPPGCRQTEQW